MNEMNKILLQQIDKIKSLITESTEDQTDFIISKRLQTSEASDFIIGNLYKIKVESYIVTPYEGFNLHDNWNHGIPPSEQILNVEVKEIMGKMIRVVGSGDTTKAFWEGWLPKKSITILERY